MLSEVYKIVNRILDEKRFWVILLAFLAFCLYILRGAISDLITADIDPVAEQAKVSEVVNEELEKILEWASADRVYIFQFHNGVTYYNGQHAQRFTCTYEIVRDGISQEADNLKDLQVSVYSWFINETISGRMAYGDTEDIPNYTTRYSLHSQGIKSIRVLPIIHKNQVIGMIGIDYVSNPNPFLMDPIAKEWFEEEAETISQYIKP